MLSSDGKKIRDFWKPKGELSRVNERHLRSALKSAGVEEHSISYFLYLPEYKSHHKKVLKALKINGAR